MNELEALGWGLGNQFASGLLSFGMDSLGISSHSRDQKLQQEMMREQMAWQSGEAQKNRDFNLDMYLRQLENYPELLSLQNNAAFDLWRKQAAGQNDIWKEQFHLQNKYNSTPAQVRRLLAAGINPSSVFGGQGQVAVSSMGSSAPSPHSAGTPVLNPLPAGASVSPVGLPTGVTSNLVQELSQFSKNVAEMKKAGMETQQIEELLDLQVQELQEKVYGEKLGNFAKDIQNTILSATKDYKIRKELGELFKLAADIKNVNQDTALKFEQMVSEQKNQFLIDAKKKLTEKEFEKLDLEVQSFWTEFYAKIDNIKSGTAFNYSGVAVNNTLTQKNMAEIGVFRSQSDLNYAETELTKAEANIKSVDASIAIATSIMKLSNTIGELYNNKVINEVTYREALQRVEGLRRLDNMGDAFKSVKQTFEWFRKFIPFTGGN